ncbi:MULTISPECIES: amino acid adenylation domain-containing protein [Streptomyces]|uniref:Amino acid adenylation domain-containing protein n=1 Tax=Streptomyces lonegramiae TaxID=3075524 RepID=A0ABU2XQM5_9ACTN|nr:amino acid adenylation domain-containing protein [Streptomyces sp. DSM 41529]MDT0547360.1 amino acid adenylation domain-containing protein [Streptomyces sp. DSM 41529]
MATLVDRLARTVARHPRAEAVRHRGNSLDYAALDRAADALAATLREAGVGPGDRVGLWTAKSAEGIVAVHAVLRCGAAYVPVDPAAPPARAAYILGDCAVSCLVTDSVRLATLTGPDPARRPAPGPVVLLDEAPPDAPAEVIGWRQAVERPLPDGLPPVPVDPGDLAYVLYTSGSTGAPKGVMLSHRNALAFVDWAVGEFGITHRDRLSSHAPLHFDLSVLDVFAAAAAGACLVLVPEHHKALGVALNRLVAEERITVWYSVPGALTRMLDARNHQQLSSSPLRRVLFAGEEFPVKHLRRLRAALPDAGLYNLYGPTETNVCTYHRVTDADLAPGRTAPPPIGRPCPYATVRLVGADGRPVPGTPGAEGELVVEGDSVMLGYWDAADRGAPPVRAHATGDLVRHEGADGYRFVGRRDHMVKVRGYRIEPAEIEAALLALPEVHEALCVTVPDGADPDAGLRLEAYVVPAAGRSPDEARLRRHCLDTLPRYMVPARFRLVADLVRTSTGKADRRALAAAAERDREAPCPSRS